jgi:hypothetical protein
MAGMADLIFLLALSVGCTGVSVLLLFLLCWLSGHTIHDAGAAAREIVNVGINQALSKLFE